MGWGEAKLFRPQSLKLQKWYIGSHQNSKTNICSSQDNIKKVKRQEKVGETISKRLVSRIYKIKYLIKKHTLICKKPNYLIQKWHRIEQDFQNTNIQVVSMSLNIIRHQGTVI